MRIAASMVRTGAVIFGLVSGLAVLSACALWLGVPTWLGGQARTPVRTASRVSLPIPPAVPPMIYRPVSRAEAFEINAALIADDPGPPAKAFVIGQSGHFDRAADCLATAVYYEAASEDEAGQKAVAQVVLNRVRHPAFPNSVCAVVYQGAERTTGCQFTFTCDGSLKRTPASWAFARARRIAAAALNGAVYAPVGVATHYHANWVVPYWASSLTKAITVGAHLFYRWKGGWGVPSAFRQRYSAFEPDMTIGLAGGGTDPAAIIPTDIASLTSDTDGPTGGGTSGVPSGTARLKVDETRPLLAADLERGGLIPELRIQRGLLADAGREAVASVEPRDAIGRAAPAQAR